MQLQNSFQLIVRSAQPKKQEHMVHPQLFFYVFLACWAMKNFTHTYHHFMYITTTYVLCTTYPKVNPLDRGIPMHLMVICSIKYTSMYIEKELIKRKYRCAVHTSISKRICIAI